jgi:hypothetical protein
VGGVSGVGDARAAAPRADVALALELLRKALARAVPLVDVRWPPPSAD